ncbi:sialate O-acetylesterase [Paenibacillus sacheonensis]|uniref:Sialate O-acetylesterase domain-containing protein n=1 Tax=Paenibacillus sacheonensis TaxID=742054 RepID=A0A7X4YJF7_9BACL|nr:sialate O-acetylesterase [Paenibacillus sacheonensis]MBM7564284.1 hypothetical protein [Paenibacillus sacheonensis]NBC67393.1 hypothetical protein [Paenibacillus sacheonensis]
MTEWKQLGVRIERGPSNWQILQQRGGAADIRLAGSWHFEGETNGRPEVYGRVVNENDGTETVGWTACRMFGDDKWEVELRDVPAGGLYRIETCLAVDEHTVANWPYRGDIVHHVGVGDLWIIAGQSNAAGYGRGPFHDPPEMGVHVLRDNGSWDLASHPFNESTGTIYWNVYEVCNTGHSPFLAFGRMVRRETGYPVGFVMGAQGGAPLKDWAPNRGLLDIKLRRALALAGGQARGVLWYQGESDTGTEEEAWTYGARFAALVGSWRELLGDPALPVLTVQLNRYYQSPEEAFAWNRKWGVVREMQRRAAEELANVYVVPSLDCPFSDQIHSGPAGNMLLGERLARTALGAVYGKRLHFKAPNVAEAVEISAEGEPAIRLRFDGVAGTLVNIGLRERPFRAEDEAGELGIANWTVEGTSSVVLHLERKIVGKSEVHGAAEVDPSAVLPLDSATFLPMLAFYGVQVQQKN